MWKWLRINWKQRQFGAMADLVYATGNIAPDWNTIEIKRTDSGVVLSIVADTAVTVHRLSPQP